MSKRETFKRNILGLTHARRLATATTGWEVIKHISLSDAQGGTACELCGTQFWTGALIRRPPTATRKEVRITVGGTCLETILRGSFSDRTLIAARKQAVNSRLKQTFGDLIEDPGNWIKWLIEHVPTRLAPLAAQLYHLGMVPTDAELNRLIKYHDAHRTYPTSALLPILDGTTKAAGLPARLTIDGARAWLKELTPARWTKILAHRSDDFRTEEIDGIVSDDAEWHAAWKLLNEGQKRTVVALSALSPKIDFLEDHNGRSVIEQLPGIPALRSSPFFVWVNAQGLGLVAELSDDVADGALVWLWNTNKYLYIDLGTCRSISKLSEDAVVALEALAFWEQPAWYRGRVTINDRKPNGAKNRSQRASKPQPPAVDEYAVLARMPCMAKMIDIARYFGQFRATDQLEWLKARLHEMGRDWPDVVWQAERYSSSSDCREKIDNLLIRLSSR